MSKRHRKPLFAVVVLLVTITAVSFVPRWQPRVTLVVISTLHTEEGWVYDLEVRSADMLIFDHIRRPRVFMAGHWTEPDTFACRSHSFIAPGSKRLFTVIVPEQAGGFRVDLDCCRLGFLGKAHVFTWQRWPKLTEWVLNPLTCRFPPKPVWHPVSVEVLSDHTPSGTRDVSTKAHNFCWSGCADCVSFASGALSAAHRSASR